MQHQNRHKQADKQALMDQAATMDGFAFAWRSLMCICGEPLDGDDMQCQNCREKERVIFNFLNGS